MPDDIQPTAAQNADLERERLTSLINSMGDGVVAIDETEKIVVTNGAALNILDINSNPAGKFITDVLQLIDRNNQPIDLKEKIAQTKTSTATRDWRIRYPDGEAINVYVSIAPVRLGYGKEGTRGHVILLRDITHEKSLEEERDEFISVISHELRTPIAIAEGNIGNAQFLAEKAGNTNPIIRDSLKEAHGQITFLAGLINDLSTLSRAERGKLNVEISNINIHDLLHSLATMYTKQAEAKGLEIKTALDPHLELLKSSELYTREILQNLITNALKYTEQGHITIGAQAHPGGVLFYISDTGIGIAKGDQEKIFDKFFRSEDFRTRKNNGTGLGLYVTLKLARLLHAELEVKSEINQGSTFSVFIPNLHT